MRATVTPVTIGLVGNWGQLTWQASVTTQRWTTDPIQPLQKDELYTGTIGFNLPSQAAISASVARELVDHRSGVYAGVRLTRILTTCSRCLLKGRAY